MDAWAHADRGFEMKGGNTNAAAAADYYVYVYIDPRNYNEFYYGKGKGSRKDAHLSDTSDSDKASRIQAILDAGLEPIVRVIARGLTEHEAFLVEKTLLWKLGRSLTNISSGFYAEKFRPHDTLHRHLTGFDYHRSIYYYNVGEGPQRCWEDYTEFGFISGGQGPRWRDAMLGFNEGDVVCAYISGKGYVGIGKITAPARPVRDVSVNGKPLLTLPLRANLGDKALDDELCEYAATVDWLAVADREHAKWQPKSNVFTSQLVRASLNAQPNTIAFLEEAFGQDLRALVA